MNTRKICIVLILLPAIVMAFYMVYLKSTIENRGAGDHDKYIRYSISVNLLVVRDLDREIIILMN